MVHAPVSRFSYPSEVPKGSYKAPTKSADTVHHRQYHKASQKHNNCLFIVGYPELVSVVLVMKGWLIHESVTLMSTTAMSLPSYESITQDRVVWPRLSVGNPCNIIHSFFKG
jgi:hypothetical protein